MIHIKDIGRSKNWTIALVKCGFCWNEKQILKSNIKKTRSCWCKKHELFLQTRANMSEKNKIIIDFWDYIEMWLSNWWFTKIDKEDYEKIKWNTWYKSCRWYAESRIEWKLVKLHRLLCSWKIIDHINIDTMDNRKDNLRVCTHAQNMQNSKNRKISNRSSIYKWVYKNKKWKFIARCKGTYIWSYESEQVAALEYNKIASQLFWEFAYLNTIK